MESNKSVSPEFFNVKKSRSSSFNETTLNELSNKNEFIKHDYSDLVNKYLIIPENLFSFNFDILKIDEEFILRNIVCYIFKIFFEKTDFYKINSFVFKLFVKDICDNYLENKYHNFQHAVYVLHTVFLLMEECNLFYKLNNLVSFSILISALVHDVGHPGNNNLFEINTCSELACRYNDLSVLEQFHCHLAFEIIKKNNLFENFTQEEFIMCRKIIINCILATDISNHKILLEIIQSKKDFGFNFDILDEQYLLAKILVHASDISNPIQEFKQCETWAKKVSIEFHNQIQKEKDRGIKPFSCFNINSLSSFYNHEIKYINLVCKPYWEALIDIFDCLKPLLNNINTNLEIYHKSLIEIEKYSELYLEEY
jgi:hypothetical protein